jgi:hypothetical protein
MTLELQSSKKKSKKDRKTSDDRKRKGISSQGDLAVNREEAREWKRKEKGERGALSFSLALQCADPDTVICTCRYRCKKAQG